MDKAQKYYFSKINLFEAILQKNLNIKKEKLLIIGDLGSKDYQISTILTNSFIKAAKNLNLNYDFIIIKKTKDKSNNMDKELEKKILNLPKKSTLLISLSNGLGKSTKINSIRKFAKTQKHKYAISASLGEIKTTDYKKYLKSLDVNYEELNKTNNKIITKLKKATTIKITTKKGTNLTAKIDKNTITSSLGVNKIFGQGGNLPGSEVYFAPKLNSANGTIIIDASSKLINQTQKLNHPITIQIQNGKITSITGKIEAKRLLKELTNAKNDNALKICEIGIGTNPNASILGAIIIDEKVKNTAHIAFGNNLWFNGKLNSNIHLDQVFKKPTIYLDEKKIVY
jgi:leucyl aminopeptidase (aminopeptidase T)